MTTIMISSVSSVLLHVVLGSVFIFLLTSVWIYLRSPTLMTIPGPLSAKFSNIWRLVSAYRGLTAAYSRRLHEQHGTAVRMGPNFVSLSDPRLIKTLYSTKGDYTKSALYNSSHVSSPDGRVVETQFSTRNELYHGQVVRPIKKYYSMTSLLGFEPLVDQTINHFCSRLEQEFVDGPHAGEAFDMKNWITYFAWDTMSQITFSHTLGFLDKGGDVHDLIHGSNKFTDYVTVVGQMPSLDQYLNRNPCYRFGHSFSFAILVDFSLQAMKQRQLGSDKERPDVDLLDRFFEVQATSPSKVGNNLILSWVLNNVRAGSDTIASTLSGIIYYVLKNPAVLKRLQEELDNAAVEAPVSWKTAQALPYLGAVIYEGLRLHPAIGLALERIVPKGGLTLPDGRFIAEKTIVGMNAWVLHHNQEIFGADTDSFVPERWLKQDGEECEAFAKRRAGMMAAILSFGGGKRVCMGSNLALLEMHKLVATLFATFDVRFVDPMQKWRVKRTWFVQVEGINVTLKRRGRHAA